MSKMNIEYLLTTTKDPFPYLRPPFDNSSFDSAVIPDPEEEEYQGKLDRYHRAYLGERVGYKTMHEQTF
jgi:hypothetical protein